MDDQVHLGYQAALVCLQFPTYGRLWLSVTQHPGDTISCTDAEPMIRRSGALLGLRPMRRVELLRKRLEALENRQYALSKALEEANQSLEEAHHQFETVIKKVTDSEKCVQETEAVYQERKRSVRPHSKLAQERASLVTYQKRKKSKEAHMSLAEKKVKRRKKK